MAEPYIRNRLLLVLLLLLKRMSGPWKLISSCRSDCQLCMIVKGRFVRHLVLLLLLLLVLMLSDSTPPPEPPASCAGLWIMGPTNGSQQFATFEPIRPIRPIIPSLSSPSPSALLVPVGDFFDVPIGPRSGDALVATNGAEHSFSSVPPI
uniref:Uncharacterized protein n=1 Tax=Anopheles maculatus TaxID=74869 RepID=A0A182SDS8_9DIPT